MTTKPDCYTCEHREDIPGDCHSSCNHPKASLALLVIGHNPLKINARPHGVKMGWFIWPINFDPVWLTACEGYTKKLPTLAKEQ